MNEAKGHKLKIGQALSMGDQSAEAITAAAPKLTRKDFQSDQEVRWCPGCGDYSVLAQMQKVLADVGARRSDTVFISGIGCSSRFPYYMNTYGFHTLHGRAPAIATGLKIARSDLNVWVITGDGDGLSIGGNHLIHALRRNIGLKIVLFNNRIYGLTKGQYSPTSEKGKKTRSTPMGSLDHPFNPISLALGAEATFVARTADSNPKHLQEVLRRAYDHRGGAFVEVLQNCNVFNDGAWDYVYGRDVAADAQVFVEHGKPLIFGKKRDKGIRLNGFEPEVVALDGGGEGTAASDLAQKNLLVHDETMASGALAYALCRMDPKDGLPMAMGVFRTCTRSLYEEDAERQILEALSKLGEGTVEKQLIGGGTWKVG